MTIQNRVTDGLLGPAAVAKLRTIQHMREQLAREADRLDKEEALTLGLVAEAQGFTTQQGEHVRFDYELDVVPPGWRVLLE